MMGREEFARYVERFNARDYALVLGHYAADVAVAFGNVTLRSREDVLGFYRFFHSYVLERIEILAFASSDDLVALEANVLLTGVRELAPEVAARAGYPGLIGPPVGRTLSLPQVIHYRVTDGKFSSATCLLVGDPEIAG